MARALDPKRYFSALCHVAAGRNRSRHAGASEVILIDRLVAETLVQDYLKYKQHNPP
jgi:hypothetical protein